MKFIIIEALSNNSVLTEPFNMLISSIGIRKVNRVRTINTPIDSREALNHLFLKNFLIFLLIRGTKTVFIAIILHFHFFV